MKSNLINNNLEQPDSWKSINWAKANRVVNNLSRRIFTARKQGRFRTLRNLQRLILKAQKKVRRVSMTNAGSKTAGIDNKVYLTPKERWELVHKKKRLIDT